jgi:hypothetical protein
MLQDPIPTVAALPEAPAPVVPSAELPAPTLEQQQAADGVFCEPESGLERTAATLLNIQTGLLLLHHLARETFEEPAEEEVQRPAEEER